MQYRNQITFKLQFAKQNLKDTKFLYFRIIVLFQIFAYDLYSRATLTKKRLSSLALNVANHNNETLIPIDKIKIKTKYLLDNITRDKNSCIVVKGSSYYSIEISSPGVTIQGHTSTTTTFFITAVHAAP